MDLAGLAALLAVPTGVLAVIAGPVRERGLVARLHRVEKLLAEGTMAGQPRKMLENARDHLTERIAANELKPRHTELLGIALLTLGLGVFTAAWGTLAGPLHLDPLKPRNVMVGWVAYMGGLVALGARTILRTAWVMKHRDSDYKRDESWW